jgi:acyl-coenzyme A thioesterase PaaI-like protein
MLKKFLQDLKYKPQVVRFLINAYSPLRGAGIRVYQVSNNFDTIEVHLPLTRKNKNVMGTQFGGSLYAMADPFYMLILIRRLGHKYMVWDQESHIRFLAPGTGLVKGIYRVDDQTLNEIKSKAATGEKVLHTFETDITHADGSVVAKVTKVLYIRLKKQYRPNPN